MNRGSFASAAKQRGGPRAFPRRELTRWWSFHRRSYGGLGALLSHPFAKEAERMGHPVSGVNWGPRILRLRSVAGRPNSAQEDREHIQLISCETIKLCADSTYPRNCILAPRSLRSPLYYIAPGIVCCAGCDMETERMAELLA